MAKNNNPGRILKGTKSQPSLKGASGVWTLDEALQYHRANSWPQPNLFQPIANSLRSKAASTSYFYRNITRVGNRMSWTWSAWFKRSSTGSNTGNRNGLFGAGDSSQSNVFRLYFNATDNLVVQDTQNSTDNIVVVTTQAFRDINAWYHVVVAVDTTQSTNTNRVKVYLNGSQVTSFSGTTYPAQGYSTMINGGYYETTGACYNPPTSGYVVLDGYIAENSFIDGYALQPTLFGQLDTNNTWVPIAYAGTYGTNGFYLPFINATTSQTLGYDAGLTGTPTYGADQDPYRGSVALHLTGNGPAGGQNNTFADSSPNNLAFTRNGSTTQGSFSPFALNTNAPYNPAVNGASAYFNGTTDYIYTASNALFNVGSNNVTVEAWVYLTAFNQGASPYISTIWSLDGSGTNNTFFYVYRTGSIAVGINGVNEIASATGVITLNTWFHTAVVRNGSTTTVYVNGVSVASNTTAVWANTGSRPFYVGSNPQSAYYYLTGYIASMRFLMNAVVYTANFTPTMRPFGTLTNNLLPFSEDISNSTWTAQSQNVSFTANAAIAPDGTPSATLIVPSTSSAGTNIAGLHDSSAGVNTFSIYAKSAGYRYIQCLHSRSAGGDSGYVTFDLTTGAVTNSSVWSGSIVNAGNGWYRLVATTSSLSGASASSNVRWAFTDGSASRAPSFTGNGTSGVYFWGAQAELASSATNYTPTPANYSTAPAVLMNFANAAIVDSTGATDVVVTGGATVTSSSKYGSGALVFNNTGASQTDYLNIQNCDCYFPGDFTVEFWFNPQYLSTSWTDFAAILDLSASVNTDYNWWVIHQVNQTLYWATNGGTLTAGNINVLQTGNVLTTANTWYHVALVRNQTNLSFYINGNLSGTISSNAAFGSRRALTVGAQNSQSSRFTRGSIDDLRITKGLARYTSNFTPPVRALPETGGKSFVTVNINAGVVKTFTTVGTTSWTAPSDVTQIEVLVVAGGGGGGRWGGGGGAGGLIYNNNYNVTPGQTYTITVGAGGAGWAGDAQSGGNAGSGTNSIFGNLIAIGGGGGGNYGNSSPGPSNGANGGSSGGAGSNGPSYNNSTHTGGTPTPGQGFSGGSSGGYYGGSGGTLSGSGGGGGAGGAGANFGTPTGGASLQFGISGTPTYYAGGGGGMMQTGSTLYAGGAGSGGAGGGGASSTTLTSAQVDGVANTGGGGGGTQDSTIAGVYRAGTGGSGIVIVRYTTTAIANSSDATTDTLTDSPTLYGHDMGAGGEVVGNYATFNPLIGANLNNSSVFGSSIVVFSNGNLNASNPALSGSAPKMQCHSTIGMTTGKWYAEFTGLSGRGAGISLGDYVPAGGSGPGVSNCLILQPTSGVVTPSTGATATVTGTPVAISSTDVVGVAFDVDNRVCYYYRNGVLVQTASSITTTLGTPYSSSGTWYFSSQPESSGSPSSIIANFGQRAWQYNPPQGFSALTLKNFPRPVVGSAAAAPNQYFDTVLYTGTGANATITTPSGFAPDLVWIKNRSTADSHRILDTIRGATKFMASDLTNAEATDSVGLTSFTGTGFTLGTDSSYNFSGRNYVAWCWRAGGASIANTNGTINTQVSTNTASGFSVVTYTGTGVAGTIGHGLGKTPDWLIFKNRSGSDGWIIFHSGITATTWWDTRLLFTTANAGSGAGYITSAPGASTIALSTGSPVNASGSNYVLYAWNAVPGFSRFGSYTGNNNVDGPFVYCGFRPKYIIIKNTTTTNAYTSWQIQDTNRQGYNGNYNFTLWANTNYPEGKRGDNTVDGSNTLNVDFVSNGFKVRASGSYETNNGSDVYVYAAFAEAPFTNTNGTAR